MKKIVTKFLFLICVATFSACGGGDGNVGTSAGNPAYFPSGLAVASPFDTTEDDGDTSDLSSVTLAQSGAFISRYAAATARINQILNGTTPSICRFDPSLFLAVDTNAECYGPTVNYEGHPDYNGELPPAPQEDDQLPSGDVGLWVETDTTTGHACAAAQLNARLESLRGRSLAALMGLASLICTANANSISLPSGATEDLTTEMNALGISGVTLNEATLTHSSSGGSDTWSYHLDILYEPGSETYDIVVDLTHIPDSTTIAYQGRLSYRVNDTFDPRGNCPSTDQTYNGSLLYDRAAADDLNVEVRSGIFCGHDADGLTDGLVDPSLKHDNGTDSDGWANNFNLFTADFDPTTLEGNYAFSWQAGDGDEYTRVLNAVVREDTNEDSLFSNAFYGFGDDVEDTDGSITGFFCNWAGPNGQQNFASLTQQQGMELNATTGKFEADTTNILYAPTNSCDYDGTGTFTYDSTIDETVDTDPADPILNVLPDLEDLDGDGTFDIFSDNGFLLPTPPANL